MKKFDMNRHLKGHRQPVEVPVFACSECSYTTRRKCDMPKHLLTHCESGTGKIVLYIYYVFVLLCLHVKRDIVSQHQDKVQLKFSV